MHRNVGLLIDLPALPAGVTCKALREFVRAGLADAGYRGFALVRAVSECSIIRVTDLVTGESTLRGMVRVWPAKAAMTAIEILRGRPLLGQPVEVRRHVHATAFASDGSYKPRPPDPRCCERTIELIER